MLDVPLLRGRPRFARTLGLASWFFFAPACGGGGDEVNRDARSLGCEPLATVSCNCPDGVSTGEQRCNAEGNGLSECLGCGAQANLEPDPGTRMGGSGGIGGGEAGAPGSAGAGGAGGISMGGSAGDENTGGWGNESGSGGMTATGGMGGSGGTLPGPLDVPDIPECALVADWPPAWAAWEEEVLDLVNQQRAAGATCGGVPHGPVGPLTMEPRQRCAARLHSLDMIERAYFDHDSPDGVGFCERISELGYGWSAIAENITTSSTPALAVSGWMTSTGHCQNIMNGMLEDTGVGYAAGGSAHRWTQTFGRPGGGGILNCQ
jgi:hypothetical protein